MTDLEIIMRQLRLARTGEVREVLENLRKRDRRAWLSFRGEVLNYKFKRKLTL